MSTMTEAPSSNGSKRQTTTIDDLRVDLAETIRAKAAPVRAALDQAEAAERAAKERIARIEGERRKLADEIASIRTGALHDAQAQVAEARRDMRYFDGLLTDALSSRDRRNTRGTK